ncbi:pre-rRNA processing protein [Linderina pennispora]|nr:pre-rRNA processing protein [Linderina pennispora]
MDSGLEQQLKKLRNQINSKAPHQQQHAATLLAVEETLKERKAPMEPASYFAALLTLLEQQAGTSSKGLSSAIIYLLSIILPHVSHNTLRAKFTTMMAVLSQSLDLGSADVALLRAVISCLESVLTAQDAGSWGQPIALGSFQSLLALATDSKPKIRKRAQEAVVKLLAHVPPPATVHPATHTVAKFVLTTLGNAKADTQAAMHTLQLVKAVDLAWPAEEFRELCSVLMQLPKLNTPFITTLSFQALESAFSSAAAALDEDQFRDLLAEVIDIKPNIGDALVSDAWLKIVQKGYISYAQISPIVCFQSLPELIDLILPDIELGKPSTREAATQCIWALLRECIPDSMLESPEVERIVKILSSGVSYRYRESWTLMFLLLAALFQRLGSVAHPVMDSILLEISNMRMEPEFELKSEADAVLGAAVRAIGPAAFLQVLPLNLTADQRSGSAGRAWLLPLMKSHIRDAPLAYFVQNMLPLADDLAAQSLRFSSQGREIESKVFGALSQQVWGLLGGFCNVPSDVVQSFSVDFAARLASEMFESAEVRPAICGALQTLVSAVHSLAHSDTEVANAPLTKQQALAAEQHLAQFAPDYLSQLFNVFALSPGASRGYLVETIVAFLSIITPAEVNATFVKVCSMLDEALKTHKPPAASELTERYLEAHPPPTAHTMMDLAIVMAPYLDAERTQMLVQASFLLLKQAEDSVLQKKGYKAVYKLASQEQGSAARQTVESIMSDALIPALIESAESVAMASRRDRLALVSVLADGLNNDQLHFIPALLSEAILGTKEVNERVRIIAFDTLLAMGRRMSQGGVISMAAMGSEGETQQASTEEFFKMIAAGLAAQTPHMISATIAALSRALFEFHSQLQTSFVLEILGTVLMFVTHNNREIAKSSLGFVKVASVILPKDLLEQHLEEIVQSILKWSHEYKNQMRLKCRHILDRLVRRVGLDAVDRVTPEEHKKLIANMRKRQVRAKRTKEPGTQTADTGDVSAVAAATATASEPAKKSFGNAYEDALYGSESELDDSDDEPAQKAKRQSNLSRKQQIRDANAAESRQKNKGGAWIREDAEGPLDFLDRTAFTHFAFTNPAGKQKRERAAPKMEGGKFVFEDPEDLAKLKEAAAAAAAANPDEAQGEDYYLQSITSKDGFTRTASGKIKFHKRKAGDENDDVEMESGDEEAAKTPIGKRSKTNTGAAVGREFRSKKAKGDVKRGNVDPYAYVPLNPKSMKKGGVSIKGNSKKDKRTRRK